ncbi:hypothetical protein SMICM17S_07453 [Streptomyces microflavus]
MSLRKNRRSVRQNRGGEIVSCVPTGLELAVTAARSPSISASRSVVRCWDPTGYGLRRGTRVPALADAEHMQQASAAALSATPWPTRTGAAAWGPVWLGILLAITAVYGELFAVAARSWRDRTGG